MYGITKDTILPPAPRIPEDAPLFEEWYDLFPKLAGDLYPELFRNPNGAVTAEYIAHLAKTGEEILRLKREKQFLFLSHYYSLPQLQDISDVTGDSLALARVAAECSEKKLVFITVHFMASNAKAYVGDAKRVFVLGHPDLLGCSLVASINHKEVEAWREAHPDGIIITYINSDVYTKSLSDYVCTSRNAEAILRHVKDAHYGKPILFMPDKFLAQAIIFKMTGRMPCEIGQTGRIIHCTMDVSERVPVGGCVRGIGISPSIMGIAPRHELQTRSVPIDIYDGACHVHMKIREQDLLSMVAAHPDAEVLVHPECGCVSKCIIRPAFGKPAHVRSTKGMLDFARESDAKTFIVATERGHVYALRRALPEKHFFPASYAAYCEYMKGNTFDRLLTSLREDKIELVLCDDCCDPRNPYRDDAVYHIPRSTALRARRAIERMLEIG